MKKFFLLTIILLLFSSVLITAKTVTATNSVSKPFLEKYVITLSSSVQTIQLDSGYKITLQASPITSSAKIIIPVKTTSKSVTPKGKSFIKKGTSTTAFTLPYNKIVYNKDLNSFILLKTSKTSSTQATLYVGDGALCMNSNEVDGFSDTYAVKSDEEVACLLFVSDYAAVQPDKVNSEGDSFPNNDMRYGYTNITSPVSVFFISPNIPNRGITSNIIELKNLPKYYPEVNYTNYPFGVIKYPSHAEILNYISNVASTTSGGDTSTPVPVRVVDPKNINPLTSSVITVGYSTLGDGGSVQLWTDGGNLSGDSKSGAYYSNDFAYHLSFYDKKDGLIRDYIINYTANLTGIDSTNSTVVNCSLIPDVNGNLRNCGTIYQIYSNNNDKTNLNDSQIDFPNITDGRVGPAWSTTGGSKQYYLNNRNEDEIVIPYFGFSNPDSSSLTQKSYLAVKFKLKSAFDSKLSEPNIGCFNGSRITFNTNQLQNDVGFDSFLKFDDVTSKQLDCLSGGTIVKSDYAGLENVSCGFDFSDPSNPSGTVKYSRVSCGLDSNKVPYTPNINSLICDGDRFHGSSSSYLPAGQNVLEVNGADQLLSYDSDLQFSVPKLTLFNDATSFFTGLGIYSAATQSGQIGSYPFTNAGKLSVYLGSKKYAWVRTLSGLDSSKVSTLQNADVNKRTLFIDVFDGTGMQEEIGFIWYSNNNTIYSLAGAEGLSVKTKNGLTVPSTTSDYQNEITAGTTWSLMSPGDITGSNVRLRLEHYNENNFSIILDNKGLESLPGYAQDSSSYDYFCVTSGNDANLDSTSNNLLDNYVKLTTTGSVSTQSASGFNRILVSSTDTSKVYAAGIKNDFSTQSGPFNYTSLLGQTNNIVTLQLNFNNLAQEFRDDYLDANPYAGVIGLLKSNYDKTNLDFGSITSTTSDLTYCDDYDYKNGKCNGNSQAITTDYFKNNNVLPSFTKLIDSGGISTAGRLTNYVFAIPKCFVNVTFNFIDTTKNDISKITMTSTGDSLHGFKQVFTSDFDKIRRIQANIGYDLKVEFNDADKTVSNYNFPAVTCKDGSVIVDIKKIIPPTTISDPECYNNTVSFDYKKGYQRVCLTVYPSATALGFNDSNHVKVKPQLKIDFIDQGKTIPTDSLSDLTKLAVIKDSDPLNSEVTANVLDGNSFLFTSTSTTDTAYSSKIDFNSNPSSDSLVYNGMTSPLSTSEPRFKLLIPSSFTKEKFNAFTQMPLSSYSSLYGVPTSFSYQSWVKLSPIFDEVDLSDYDNYLRLNTPALGKETGVASRFYFPTKNFGEGLFDLSSGSLWPRGYSKQFQQDGAPLMISYPDGNNVFTSPYGSIVHYANDHRVWLYVPLCKVAVVVKNDNKVFDTFSIYQGSANGPEVARDMTNAQGVATVILDATNPDGTNDPVQFTLVSNAHGEQRDFAVQCSEKAKLVTYSLSSGCDSTSNGDYKICISKLSDSILKQSKQESIYFSRGTALQDTNFVLTKAASDVSGVFYKLETSLTSIGLGHNYREAFKFAGSNAALPDTELYYNLLEPNKLYFYQTTSGTTPGTSIQELFYFTTTQSSLELITSKNLGSPDYFDYFKSSIYKNLPSANTHIKIADCPATESMATVSVPIGLITSKLLSIPDSSNDLIVSKINEGLRELYGPSVGLLNVNNEFISKGIFKNVITKAIQDKKDSIDVPVIIRVTKPVQVKTTKTTSYSKNIPIPKDFPKTKGTSAPKVSTDNTACLWVYETRSRLPVTNLELPTTPELHNLDPSQFFLTELTQNGLQRLSSGAKDEEAFKNAIVLSKPIMPAKQGFTAPQSTKLLTISDSFHKYSIPLCTVLVKVNVTDIPYPFSSPALPFSNATINRTFMEFTDPLNGHLGSMFLGNNMGWSYITLGLRSPMVEPVNVSFRTRYLAVNQTINLDDSMCGKVISVDQKMCYQRINYTILAPDGKLYQFSPKAYTDYSPYLNNSATLINLTSGNPDVSIPTPYNRSNNSQEILLNLFGHDRASCQFSGTFNHSMFDDSRKNPFCRVKNINELYSCQCGGLQQKVIKTKKETTYVGTINFKNVASDFNFSVWSLTSDKKISKLIAFRTRSYVAPTKTVTATYVFNFDVKYLVYINDTRYTEWDTNKIIPDDFEATLNETAFRNCATDQMFNISLTSCKVQTPTLRVDATKCTNCGLDNPLKSIGFSIYGPKFPSQPGNLLFNIFWKLFIRDAIKGGNLDPTTWFKNEQLPSQGYYKINVNNLACIKDNQQILKIKCDVTNLFEITQPAYDIKNDEFLITGLPGQITGKDGFPQGQTFISGKDSLNVFKLPISSSSLESFKNGVIPSSSSSLLGSTSLTPVPAKGFPQDSLLLKVTTGANALAPGDNLLAIINPNKQPGPTDEVNGLIYLNVVQVPDSSVTSACDRILNAQTSLSSINFEQVPGGKASMTTWIPSPSNNVKVFPPYGSFKPNEFIRPLSNTVQVSNTGLFDVDLDPSTLNYNEFRVPGGMINWTWNFTLEGECYKGTDAVYNDTKLKEASFNSNNIGTLSVTSGGISSTINNVDSTFVQKGGNSKIIPNNPLPTESSTVNTPNFNPYNPLSGRNVISFDRPRCIPIKVTTTMNSQPQNSVVNIIPIQTLTDYNNFATDDVSKSIAKNGELDLTGTATLIPPYDYVKAYKDTYAYSTKAPYVSTSPVGTIRFTSTKTGEYRACVREDYLVPLLKDINFAKIPRFGVVFDNSNTLLYTPELKYVDYKYNYDQGCSGPELLVQTDLTPLTNVEVTTNENQQPFKVIPLCILSQALQVKVVDQNAIPLVSPDSSATDHVKPLNGINSQVIGKAYLDAFEASTVLPTYPTKLDTSIRKYNIDANNHITLLQGSYNVTSLGGGKAGFCGKADPTVDCSSTTDYRDNGKTYDLTPSTNFYYDVDTTHVINTYDNSRDLRVSNQCNLAAKYPKVNPSNLACIKVKFDDIGNYIQSLDWNCGKASGCSLQYRSDGLASSKISFKGYAGGPFFAGYTFLSLAGDSSNSNDYKVSFPGVNLIYGLPYDISGVPGTDPNSLKDIAFSNLLGIYAAAYPYPSSWSTSTNPRIASLYKDVSGSGSDYVYSGCQNVNRGYTGVISSFDSMDNNDFKSSLDSLQNQGNIVYGSSDAIFYVPKDSLSKLKIGYVLLGRAAQTADRGGTAHPVRISVPIVFNNSCLTDSISQSLQTQDSQHCLELTLNVSSGFLDMNGDTYYVNNRNPSCSSSFVSLPPAYCNVDFLKP